MKAAQDAMEISLFQFQNHEIRTILDELGNPWFVAKDVCEALGIDWSGKKTLNSIPEEWQGVGSFPTPSRENDQRGGGNQELITIDEPAVYKLAFRSNKPEADNFTNWVASEVLPTIRKTGSYQVENDSPTTAQIGTNISKMLAAMEKYKQASDPIMRDTYLKSMEWFADQAGFDLPAGIEGIGPDQGMLPGTEG